MVFGLDLMKVAKAEALKPDFNKNHIPDVLELLDGGEAGLEALADLTDDFDADEAFTALSMLNGVRKPEKQKSEAELREIAAKVVLLPAGLRAAKGVLEQVEAELKKK